MATGDDDPSRSDAGRSRTDGGDEPRAEFEPPPFPGPVETRELSPSVHGADLTALIAGNTAFALDVYRELRSLSPTGNLVFGAYSVSQAMAMLYAGARGETALQMKNAMRFDVAPVDFHRTFNGLDLELLSRNPDVVLRNANQVWLREGFATTPGYDSLLLESYDAPTIAVDFAADPEAARQTINQWVSDATEEKIAELFPTGAISANTVLALTNAMYLDAPWKYPFDPERTNPRSFTLLDDTVIDVETMHYDLFLPTASGQGWTAVELPYRGDELSMVVVVPRDFTEFEANLNAEVFDDIIAQIRDGGVHLSLPKFSFSYHASLVPVFRALGLDALFDTPDLSGIGDGVLAVSAIEHEAFIEVDEEGTEAAATTGIVVDDSHGPEVNVDRPFLYFIIDKPTRSLLFLGSVLDPRD